MVNIDQSTGLRETNQPLATLASYRRRQVSGYNYMCFILYYIIVEVVFEKLKKLVIEVKHTLTLAMLGTFLQRYFENSYLTNGRQEFRKIWMD